jgi:hypothetical protein
MKISQVLQSLFIALILAGLSAMMAKNGYGYTLMGLSCFGLAALYFAQIIWKVIEDFSGMEKKEIPGILELLLLAILISLFGFRAFYINVPFSDLIFISVCGLLIVVYSLMAAGTINTAKKENPAVAGSILFFFSSLILFLLSLGTRIFNPYLSAVIGALGILASVPFLFSLLRQKRYNYSGRSITLLQFIVSSRNKVGMLFLFFMFSGIYMGLSNFKIIPAIENADKPPTYIELINQAESGKEKPVNGKYQHEIYKEAMDKFLQRHGNKKSLN